MADACGSCHAPIWWAQTAKGARMPMDYGERDDGNVLVAGRLTNGTVVVAVVKPGEGMFVSHYATCPNGKQHRKAKP